MSDLRAPHLSDAEIDAYWKGTLAAADEVRVEDHYLECDECTARVKLVEDLVANLRLMETADATTTPAGHVRVWQAVAAALAGFAVIAGWQWAQLAREAGAVMPGEGPSSAVSRATGPEFAITARLEPPTRDAGIRTVTLAPDTKFVIFEIDAREGGAPRTRFDASLADPTGRALLRLAGVESAEDGRLHVPVAASLFTSGRYVFQLTAGATVVSYPFAVDSAPITR